MPQIQELMGAPSFGGELGKALGGGVGQGISAGLQQSLSEFHENQKTRKSEEEFLKQGFPADLAKLAAIASKGGETHILKELLEERKRGMSPQNIAPTPDEEINVEDYVKQADSGLTPTERFRRASERYKSGLPIAQEANTRLRGLQRDKERFDILENLDKSGKLPKTFGRLNVDEEGNLKFPFVASAESQRFVKTLNEFSSGAKDTFGSRVTNFDLQQYLKRYPTLLNSSEGRKQLVKQMKIVNEINSEYYRNVKKVFDKAGGARNIDTDVAESMAEKMSEKRTGELVKKFEEIGQFSTLPAAGEFKGKKIKDKETGEILESNGNEWIPVQ